VRTTLPANSSPARLAHLAQPGTAGRYRAYCPDCAQDAGRSDTHPGALIIADSHWHSTGRGNHGRLVPGATVHRCSIIDDPTAPPDESDDGPPLGIA
jgi:hypothetical protein